MPKGHVIKNCHARKYDVPKGIMKWIPKGSKKPNQDGPNLLKGTK